MSNSGLLKHAWKLRDEDRFREAYNEFLKAAKNTDRALEKSGILLDAATNLTQLGEYNIAREELNKVSEILLVLDPKELNQNDRDEFYRVLIGINLEQAQILWTEGNVQSAIAKLEETLKEFEVELKDPRLTPLYDGIQSRRAYFLADVGSFEKAIHILEKLESRQNKDTLFLLYLGHCYFWVKLFDKAQQTLQTAIALNPPHHIAFQAHGVLGMVFYELGDYPRAKQELETSVNSATARYIKEAKIWKWLEYTCRHLGLQAEATRYAQLANPC